MVTTTVCLALVSVDDLGFDTLITFGLAKVDTIKKNNNNINKISFSAPVCTSGECLNLGFKFIKID
jgi:hypothetical protein